MFKSSFAQSCLEEVLATTDSCDSLATMGPRESHRGYKSQVTDTQGTCSRGI